MCVGWQHSVSLQVTGHRGRHSQRYVVNREMNMTDGLVMRRRNTAMKINSDKERVLLPRERKPVACQG